MYLWLFVHVRGRIRSVTASPNSSKAPSPRDFVATCGFSLSRTFAPKAQKQQVCPFSYVLGAFAAPQRWRRKYKSNKSVRFPMYLWLFVHVRGRIRSITASPNSSKAPSPRDFVATCGFSLSRTFAPKAQKQQVCPFSYVLGAFAAPQRLRRKLKIPNLKFYLIYTQNLRKLVIR